MIKRNTAVLLVLLFFLLLAGASPARAQFFGVVYDPTNYANAVLRYGQLQQQYAQLVLTYQQIRTQYLLISRQAQRLAGDLNARYRSLPTFWQPFAAEHAYDTTTGWILSANTGESTLRSYTRATQPLLTYGSAMAALPSAQASRAKANYDRAQLTDAANVHALEALGSLRKNQASVETTIRRLEDDAYSGDADLHTQIAVLNKINATAVTSARLARDTNNLLISLLEQQLIAATNHRDAAVEAIDAHIAFVSDARSLLARTTAQTTSALSTFRIP